MNRNRPTIGRCRAPWTWVIATPSVIAFALTMAGGAHNDEPPEEPTPSAEAPQPSDDDETPASLDDLLGIASDEGDRSAAEAARRDSEEQLKRELAETRIADAFAIALAKMSTTADLLDVKFDSGLGTQRLQEEILVKLDQLIDQARKLQSAGGSSVQTGTPSQSSTPPKPGPRGNNPRTGEQREGPARDSQAGDPPPRRDGDLNRVLQEHRSEWGHLPQRIRDMLLQGRTEKFSSMYEQLTREYYRHLAEDGSS